MSFVFGQNGMRYAMRFGDRELGECVSALVFVTCKKVQLEEEEEEDFNVCRFFTDDFELKKIFFHFLFSS